MNITLITDDENLQNKGIIGLTYNNFSSNVIPLHKPELAIMVIDNSQVDEHLNNIVKISNNSTLSILFIRNADQNVNTRLLNAVDTLIPSNSSNDELHWIIRAIVETVSLNNDENHDVRNWVGVDISDIGYIMGNGGLGHSVVVNGIDSFRQTLDVDNVENSTGVLLVVISSVIDTHFIEEANKMIGNDVAIIHSMIEDRRMSDEMKIVVIFTGLH